MAATDGRGDGVQVTLARPLRILHFSDGVEEEFEEGHARELSAVPSATEPEHAVDPSTLTWGPWLSHYAWKSGQKVLGGMDYAGEGLASFFGITTPKYQIEIDEHERLQEEKRQMEAESAGWVAKESDGQIPLVMNAPVKEVDRPAQV